MTHGPMSADAPPPPAAERTYCPESASPGCSGERWRCARVLAESAWSTKIQRTAHFAAGREHGLQIRGASQDHRCWHAPAPIATCGYPSRFTAAEDDSFERASESAQVRRSSRRISSPPSDTITEKAPGLRKRSQEPLHVVWSPCGDGVVTGSAVPSPPPIAAAHRHDRRHLAWGI